MSTSSSSAIFSGTSRYSSDFTAIINRATAIAALPITQLKADETALGDQTTALTSLGSKFTALQNAADSLSQALGGSSFQSDVSDPTKISVTLGDGAAEGNYSIEVVDAGAYATSMSSSAWVTDTGAVHTYQLSLGGVTHTVTPADNSVGSVAAAINAQYGDQVRAVVVNVGTSQAPDYRISLQAAQLGNLQPGLTDNGTQVQTQQTVGAKAQYVVNDSGLTVTSTTRTVTIATGITVNLLASAPGDPVDFSVIRSTSALSTALGSFAAAYNDAVDEVSKQYGAQGGALSGQAVVRSLSQLLSQISTYTGGSQITGLADIGLDLDKTGHLTFSPLNLMAADMTNSSGVDAFLGSTTGGGFLKLLTDSLNSVQDPTGGLIPSAEAGITTQTTNIDNTIADEQDRVDKLTAQLQQQMSSADALIASMEQQYNYMSSLFQAQDTANKQYQ